MALTQSIRSDVSGLVANICLPCVVPLQEQRLLDSSETNMFNARVEILVATHFPRVGGCWLDS